MATFITFECMLVKVIRTIIMVITGKSKGYFTIHFTIHHHCHLNDKSLSPNHFHITSPHKQSSVQGSL